MTVALLCFSAHIRFEDDDPFDFTPVVVDGNDAMLVTSTRKYKLSFHLNRFSSRPPIDLHTNAVSTCSRAARRHLRVRRPSALSGGVKVGVERKAS